jgi:uncharacterized repeat protein (TIGR02543 family)
MKFNLKFKLKNIIHKSVVSTILALLFVMLVSFSPLFSVFSSVSFFSFAFEVNVTTEVELRDAIAGAMGPTTITIMNDITLTGTTLTIPVGVDITLKSANPTAFCTLTGASGKPVITVNGILTLDGLILTHVAGNVGNGVTVKSGGTFTMVDGEISGNSDTEDGGGGVHIAAVGTTGASFTMRGGIICNNVATLWGGGVNVVPGSTFSMYGGVISGNKANGYGVGGGVNVDGTFIMYGGEITDNTASSSGGGVYSRGTGVASNFTMVNGLIFNNNAASGGGVAIANPGEFTLKGGKIFDNTASTNGGGVYNDGAIFNMTGTSTISDNTALNGGGVYTGAITGSASRFNMSESSVISNNNAVDGGGVYVYSGWFNVTSGTISGNTATNSGGGIWVTDSPINTAGLERLTIEDAVVFSNNIASGAYDIDPAHSSYYDALIGSNVVWSVPFTQGYNNYDISYISGPQVLYHIRYYPNTGTGSMSETPVLYNKIVTLKSNAFIKAGNTFTGWTTEADGTGTSYTNGASFTYQITGALPLYAQWSAVLPAHGFIVTYLGNGATGGSAPVDNNSYDSGESVYVVANTGGLVRSGYTFMGWAYSSTASTAVFAVIDNSVSPASFTIHDNVDLFAVWSPTVYTVTYQPGTHGTFTAQVTTNLHYGDQTPAAPTVTGDAGWTFTGWQPTPSATVTSDTTYVAQWTQTISPSPSPSATASPTSTPYTDTSPSTLRTGAPILTTTPTVSPPIDGSADSSRQVWALVNLVLSIAGVILAIIVILYALLQRKQKKEQQTDQKKQRQHRRIWLATVIIAGIAGVIVFLLTEDMKLSMTMVDNWTIINAIIFIIEIIAIILTFKRKKDTTNNKEQERSNTT